MTAVGLLAVGAATYRRKKKQGVAPIQPDLSFLAGAGLVSVGLASGSTGSNLRKFSPRAVLFLLLNL